jgi:capsid protein
MANAVTNFFKRIFKGRDYEELSNQLSVVEETPKSGDDFFGVPKQDAFYYGDNGYSWPFTGGGDGSKWDYGLSATGSSPFFNHWYLRQNARSAYHDTSQARALVERFADTVVETGIKADPAPAAEMLGMSQEDAQHRDGEYFCRFMYSDRRDLQNPLQLQYLDPNQIRGTEYTSTYGFNESRKDGIVRDKDGKEIAYKVWVKGLDERYEEVTIPAKGPKSKRTMMIHAYQPEYAGQGRGYSRLSHAIQDFENLTDFTAAEIKKAIIQSSITMYTKPSPDNPASNPLEDISIDRPAGPSAGLATQTVNGDTTTVQTQNVRYQPIPEASFGVPGSAAVFGLQEGEDLKPFESTAPAESFAKFMEAFVSHLSAASSMPIEVLLMKFGQNYSASRGALVLFWRVATIWRRAMESDFLIPVYESWLGGEIAAGRVSAPGWQDARLRQAWLQVDWIGAPMPHIDPLREGKGKEIMVKLGAVDLDRLAQEYNGSDGTINRAKLKRQVPDLTVLPYEPASTIGGTLITGDDDDDDDGGGDDGDR